MVTVKERTFFLAQSLFTGQFKHLRRRSVVLKLGCEARPLCHGSYGKKSNMIIKGIGIAYRLRLIVGGSYVGGNNGGGRKCRRTNELRTETDIINAIERLLV